MGQLLVARAIPITRGENAGSSIIACRFLFGQFDPEISIRGSEFM